MHSRLVCSRSLGAVAAPEPGPRAQPVTFASAVHFLLSQLSIWTMPFVKHYLLENNEIMKTIKLL